MTPRESPADRIAAIEARLADGYILLGTWKHVRQDIRYLLDRLRDCDEALRTGKALAYSAEYPEHVVDADCSGEWRGWSFTASHPVADT